MSNTDLCRIETELTVSEYPAVMDGRTILTHARHCAIASMYEKRRNMTVSGLSCKQVGVKPISEKASDVRITERRTKLRPCLCHNRQQKRKSSNLVTIEP